MNDFSEIIQLRSQLLRLQAFHDINLSELAAILGCSRFSVRKVINRDLTIRSVSLMKIRMGIETLAGAESALQNALAPQGGTKPKSFAMADDKNPRVISRWFRLA